MDIRAFIKHTNSPRAYLIGRNQEVAKKIISEANTEAKIEFIPADCSLLKEVSRVCKEINEQEDALSAPENGKINLLVMSHGSSGLGGRSETPEGLDAKFSLIYQPAAPLRPPSSFPTHQCIFPISTLTRYFRPPRRPRSTS